MPHYSKSNIFFMFIGLLAVKISAFSKTIMTGLCSRVAEWIKIARHSENLTQPRDSKALTQRAFPSILYSLPFIFPQGCCGYLRNMGSCVLSLRTRRAPMLSIGPLYKTISLLRPHILKLIVVFIFPECLCVCLILKERK